MYFVYSLIDPRDNLPFYIGKGSGDRPKVHLYETYEATGNRKKWCKIQSIRNNGYEPIIVILKEGFIDEQEAYKLEAKYIAEYGRKGIDANGILTNICIDNRPPSSLGRIVSEETSKNHSLRQLGELNHRYGKHWSEEEKEKRRQFNLINNIKPPVRTTPHTEQTKAKMSLAALGKKKSKEHCKNIGLAKKGKKYPDRWNSYSEETKTKMIKNCQSANVRNYLLTNGEKQYFLNSQSLKEFRVIHKLNKGSLAKTKHTKIPYKGYVLTELPKQ